MDAGLVAMTVVLYERVLYLGKLKPYPGEKGYSVSFTTKGLVLFPSRTLTPPF